MKKQKLKPEFLKELEESGYIHRPLPIHEEYAYERKLERKKVYEEQWILGKGICPLPHVPEQGKTEWKDVDGTRLLYLEAPLECPCWPKTMPQDGDCAYYGNLTVCFHLERRDFTRFQRIRLGIRPECPGVRIISLSAFIRNEGTEPVPDHYGREGSHMMNLSNNQWNDGIWEWNLLPRDQVVEIGLKCRLSGRDISSGEKMAFWIKEIKLERTEKPEKEQGWLGERDNILYSTAGYLREGKKTAIANTREEEFYLFQWGSREIVFQGKVSRVHWQGEDYGLLDFSRFQMPGEYVLVLGNVSSEPFPIGDGLLEEGIWKGLNFLFCERCGYPVPGKHGMCHGDVYARHKGVLLPFSGGWHDAGDMSQQMTQTAEITLRLLELGEAVREENGLLYQRIMEEALWGLEFVLKSRFGDGYRAASLGLVRWTNGKLLDEDDAGNVRVHNRAFDNFICAGVEAYGAVALGEYDRELAWRCKEAAREDFSFAMDRYEEKGMELPIMWEHTYQAGASLYYGAVSWAASNLYRITEDKGYGMIAVEYGERMLECQDKGGGLFGAGGFFYRDESHRAINHFSHQAREDLYLRALTLLCTTQENHPEKKRWEEGVEAYGEYIKELMKYASPYEMIPAGIYSQQEAEDQDTFVKNHLLVDYKEERENYKEQVRKGAFLEGPYYVRQFPVWFSFRGNLTVQLSSAKAAALAGNYLRDQRLLEIAREQIYWIFGKNPFGRSLMYGMGRDYEQLYSVFPGICTGQLPVGIQTKFNEDIPYWPQTNQATYKEVWTSSTSNFLSLLTEMYKIAMEKKGK